MPGRIGPSTPGPFFGSGPVGPGVARTKGAASPESIRNLDGSHINPVKDAETLGTQFAQVGSAQSRPNIVPDFSKIQNPNLLNGLQQLAGAYGELGGLSANSQAKVWQGVSDRLLG